jgi:hypothetical protein
MITGNLGVSIKYYIALSASNRLAPVDHDRSRYGLDSAYPITKTLVDQFARQQLQM